MIISASAVRVRQHRPCSGIGHHWTNDIGPKCMAVRLYGYGERVDPRETIWMCVPCAEGLSDGLGDDTVRCAVRDAKERLAE